MNKELRASDCVCVCVCYPTTKKKLSTLSLAVSSLSYILTSEQVRLRIWLGDPVEITGKQTQRSLGCFAKLEHETGFKWQNVT